MIEEIKKQLLSDHNALISLLTEFGFCHINIRNNEMRFARNESGGQNIRIKLVNNDYLIVTDFVTGDRKDIISYIITEKNTDFKTVLKSIKCLLNLTDDWKTPSKIRTPFGCYDKVIYKTKPVIKTYDESILDQYLKVGNKLWMQDGISLETQRFYDVCFDIENNGIIFPWRNDKGEIIALKSRYNGNPPEGIGKYYYPVGGNISSSLFNYSQCYQYLYGSDVIVVESEKACMQAYTFGYKNIVGLGSNNLSENQAKLLLQLHPDRIIIALDEGMDTNQIIKNINLIKSSSFMRDIKILYWDSTIDIDVPLKASPTDMGKEKFEEIMKEQLIEFKE